MTGMGMRKGPPCLFKPWGSVFCSLKWNAILFNTQGMEQDTNPFHVYCHPLIFFSSLQYRCDLLFLFPTLPPWGTCHVAHALSSFIPSQITFL